MTRPRRIAIACAVVAAFASRVAADPAPPVLVHLASGSHVVTDGGSDLRLPPGYFVDEPTWQRLDTEVKRLQDAETSLTAQNTSLRASTSGWQPGWKVLVGALVIGIAAGVYADRKF